MKYEFEFNFTVAAGIKDIDVQLGLSRETAENLSSSELRDLFTNGASDLDCGEITVDAEYTDEPELFENEDGHYDIEATFLASFSVETEGEDYEECYSKAQEKFENIDCGDYKYDNLGDLTSKRIDGVTV